jgi:hypothetical protein
MLAHLRKLRGFSASCSLLIVAILLLGTIDWWHRDDKEDAGQLARAFHDHASHHPLLRSLSTARAAEHFYVCHWLRLLGSRFGAASWRMPAAAATRRLQPETICIASALAAAILFPRAPPA